MGKNGIKGMDIKKDPMGRVIADYHKIGTTDRLRVFSPMFEEDEIPLQTLFRKYEQMPKIERKALDMAKRKTLEVLKKCWNRTFLHWMDSTIPSFC